MFKNECDHIEAKVNWIRRCADNFKKDLIWNKLDLRPAFIRHLYFALHHAGRSWFEEKISSKENFKNILLDLEHQQKTWKDKIKKIPGILHIFYKIKWFGHKRQIIKKKPLIFVNHWKHAAYLKNSSLFDGLDPYWLVDSPQMAKKIGLKSNDLLAPYLKPIKLSKSPYPFNILQDLSNGLELSLKQIRPSAIFVLEGDSPEHSLLSEIGLQLNIPVYCFQWGIFEETTLLINFAEMRFNKFLSWGPIFNKQLRPTNPDLEFISFGHLQERRNVTSGNNIIFLGQYVTSFITNSDQQHFINLAKALAKKFPKQIVWRPHPSVKIDDKELVELKKEKVLVLSSRESLTKQLENSILAISIGSSSLIEALHCGVIPICFNTTCKKKYPFPSSNEEIFFEFKNFQDAFIKITNLMNNKNKIVSIQNKIKIANSNFFSNLGLSKRRKIIQLMSKGQSNIF
jgi:hypothetical protein